MTKQLQPLTPEQIEYYKKRWEESRKRKRENNLKGIEKIRQGKYSLDGEVGELVGVVGFLTTIGVKRAPLFKTASGKHFAGWIDENGEIGSTSEIDISQEGYSFKQYTIEEFLDL